MALGVRRLTFCSPVAPSYSAVLLDFEATGGFFRRSDRDVRLPGATIVHGHAISGECVPGRSAPITYGAAP
jgi:hypothetical protein